MQGYKLIPSTSAPIKSEYRTPNVEVAGPVLI